MKNLFSTILLILVFLSLPFLSQAQEKPVKLNISTIQTELEQEALSLGIEYVQSLDSLFKKQDILVAQKNSLFQLTPAFDIQTGTNDAFSSITAKLSGILMTFKDTTIAGVVTPNTSRGFQTFPLSVGFETNKQFSIINGIAEIGWVPWYQTVGNKKTPEWLKHTKFGVFLQSGYKFEVDTSQVLVGGEIDESSENVEDVIFRAKGSFGIDTETLFELSGVGVGLVGNADGWYDFMNSEIYYTLEAKVRFYLSQQKDKFFDFEYQKGSGAPNFNQGDQFVIGLTVTF